MDNLKVLIKTDFIRLDQLLKWVNWVCSGSEAKILIEEGSIKVNQEVERKRGRKIYPGDVVEIDREIVYYIEKDEESNSNVPE